MPLVRIVLHCARREERVSQLIGFERFDLLDRSSWRSVSGNPEIESREIFVKFVSTICRSCSDVILSHIRTTLRIMDIFYVHVSNDTFINVRVIVFGLEHTRRIYSECANTLYDARKQ